MSAGEIDSFLKQKVRSCQSGYTCLKDYRQSTPDRPADAYCQGYRGAANETAATIIYKASVSCGINPQVLLVMLEKEQSLVTHTWPSSWRYDMALGQGCPDTAPCDPAFKGFFYQIYGAARQMQIYAEGRWFTWYAPGKTWNIRYSPNEACGSSPVYVENKATAALYYYTPYQPNAAALRAGYGIGDSCSAYGNRNFFNFFEDWFGSTQAGRPNTPYLVRATNADPIYLITGNQRFHVASVDDLATFTARFGQFSIREASTVEAIPLAGSVTRAVRDPRDGVIYLLEADGSKHRFPSAELVATFGYDITKVANLTPELVDAFAKGKEVGGVFRATGSPDVFFKNGSSRRHVFDQVALTEALSATDSYVASMAPAAVDSIPAAPTYFGSARLVRPSSAPEVYLTTSTSTLIHVPSLELAAAFGAKGAVVTVPTSAISAAAVSSTGLRPAVVCGDSARVIDGAAFKAISVSAAKGLGATILTNADCAKFPRTTGSLSAPKVYVAESGTRDIYLVESGKLRHVWSWHDLTVLNGSSTVVTVKWDATAFSSMALGAPLKAREGATLRFGTDEKVYVMSGNKLRHVASWDALVAIAGNNPTVDVRPPSQKSSFGFGTAVVGESQFVGFGTANAVFIMRDGNLHHVRSWDTLIDLAGGRVPPIQKLDPSLEKTFSYGSPILSDGLYVRFGFGAEVYVMQDGKLRYIQSFDALVRHAGGQLPIITSISGSPSDFPAGTIVR